MLLASRVIYGPSFFIMMPNPSINTDHMNQTAMKGVYHIGKLIMKRGTCKLFKLDKNASNVVRFHAFYEAPTIVVFGQKKGGTSTYSGHSCLGSVWH